MRIAVFVRGRELYVGQKAERIIVKTFNYALSFRAYQGNVNCSPKLKYMLIDIFETKNFNVAFILYRK